MADDKEKLLDRLTGKVKSLFAKEAMQSETYNQPVSEHVVHSHALAMLDASRKACNKRHNIFDEAHRFIHENKHWRIPRPPEISDYSGNMLFANVRTKTALVTDNKPMYDITPTKSLPVTVGNVTIDYETVEKLKCLLEDYGWYHWQLEERVESAALDGFSYGTGIIKVAWDPDTNYPLGDVGPYRVSPWAFFPFPRTPENLQEGDGCVEARVMRVDDVRRRFPDKAKYIEPQSDFSELRYDLEIQPSEAEGGVGSYATEGTGGYSDRDDYQQTKGPGRDGRYAVERVLVWEMYVRDNETEDIEEPVIDDNTGEVIIDPETGDIETEIVTRKKYPRGRLLIFTSRCVLYDGPNPNRDGKFPYAVFKAYTVPGQFWGVGEYEAHYRSQMAWNRLVCNMIDHYNGSGKKILVKKGSIENNKKITDRPNEVIEVRDVNDVKPLSPTPLPPDYFNMLVLFRSTYDTESGLHDISRGSKTPGLDKVGIALSLKESDFTRLRPVIRNFERFISEIGEMCLSRVVQHSELHRKYSYVDQETGENAELDLTGFPEDLDLFFTVRAKSNSTLPVDKPSRAAQAMQLFNMGVIGPLALLKSMDWPNIQEVVQETQLLQQLQAGMEQAQAQQAEQAQQIEQLSKENEGLRQGAERTSERMGEQKIAHAINMVKSEAAANRADAGAAER